MKTPFKWRRGRFTDNDGCVYESLHHQVFGEGRTETAGGLTRAQAREVCALLNRLDRKGVGHKKARGLR